MIINLKDRVYKLEINNGKTLYSWDDIDLKFKVVKTGSITPNQGEFTIYNLNSDHRKILENKNNIVTFTAGYKDENGVIFKGTIEKPTPENFYNAPNWETFILSKDGIKELKTIIKSVSFSPKTEVKKIIETIIKETGLTAGDLSGIPEKFYQKGFILNGEAITALKNILGQKNIDCFVTNGVINIISKNKTLNKNVILLNETSGLISVKKVNGGYIAKSLLRSSINPNTHLKIESKNLTGFMIAKNITYTGDTRTNEFYIDIELIEKQ